MQRGMGSVWGDVSGWIGQTISILGNRYGVPPAGTVVTTPGGQIIRQNPGYPTTPGGGYYPPVVTGPGQTPTFPSVQPNNQGLILAAVGVLALVVLAKK